MNRRLHLGLLLLGLTLAPANVQAETDWFASLYTSEGIELRADERVFALYSVLNAMGYDEAPILRRHPVPARELDPVRRRVIATLSLEPAQRDRLDAFFDAHPVPADAYARHALTLAGPGGFERGPGSPAGLEGIEALLAEAWERQKLGELFAALQADHRKALKAYHPVVDAPVAAVHRLLKSPEEGTPRLVLVVNLLEGRGRSLGAIVGEEQFVVVGPSEQPDLFAVVAEIARARLAPIVAKAGPLRGLVEPAAVAGAPGPHAFAVEAIARAFAAAALELTEAQLEPLASDGYWGVVEIRRAIEAFSRSEKTLETFANEALLTLALTKEPARGTAASNGKAR